MNLQKLGISSDEVDDFIGTMDDKTISFLSGHAAVFHLQKLATASGLIHGRPNHDIWDLTVIMSGKEVRFEAKAYTGFTIRLGHADAAEKRKCSRDRHKVDGKFDYLAFCYGQRTGEWGRFDFIPWHVLCERCSRNENYLRQTVSHKKLIDAALNWESLPGLHPGIDI